MTAQQPYRPGRPWLVTVINRHGRVELHAAGCPDTKGAGVRRSQTVRVRCVEAAMVGYWRETGRTGGKMPKVMPCAAGFPATQRDADRLRDVHWSGDVPKFQQCPNGHGQHAIWMSQSNDGGRTWKYHLDCDCWVTEVSNVLTTWPDTGFAEAYLANLERERKAVDEALLARLADEREAGL